MSNGKPPLVIYHGGCWDGFCAAWILRKVEPDAEFLPYQYGTDPPSLQTFVERRVYIVDFSFDHDTCQTIAEVSDETVILDHHRTAEAELKGLKFAKFDSTKSGGRLTWEHCCDHYKMNHRHGTSRKDPPWLVTYTEDRDLWKWELPRSRQINAWLRSYPLNFEYWDEFEPFVNDKDIWGRMIDEGWAIIRYQESIVEAKLQQAKRITVRVPSGVTDWPTLWTVANATTLVSETAGRLAMTSTVGCVWFEKPDGTRVYSLRSTPESDCDVSRVARFFGGGGHKHAAGFTWMSHDGKHPWESLR